MAATAYTAGYQPYVFNDFSGGLNLRDKSDTVGDKEAIDLLNVTFTDRGAIKQRDGYADLTTADLTNAVDSLAAFYTASGTKQLVAGCGSRLEAISNVGAVVASLTGMSVGSYTFARTAIPTAEYIYAGNGVDPLARWDGTAWTTGGATASVNGTGASAMPKAGAITMTAVVPGGTSGTNAANRLVATAFGTNTTGGPAGTTSTPSRVFFSNPGLPETWETDGASGRGRNFVDLSPGDGEQIMAAVTWRELVFIFKETKFFVLWGESTAADGTPVFNFREVVNNVGLAGRLAVCVGRDGVYFFNRAGIYFTNGGDPTLISDKIRPLWAGDPEVYYQGKPINLATLDKVRLAWHDEKLYAAVPTGSSSFSDRLLVYDTQHQWWSVYDIPASALVPFRRVDREELHFGYANGTKRIGRHALGILDDRGVNMTSRWRSGWSDYGIAQQKTFRETKIWATGALVVGFSSDFNPTQTSTNSPMFTSTATWPLPGGTWQDWIALNGGFWPSAGSTVDRMIDQPVAGTTLSTQFSNHSSSKTWAVHRVARHLREVRGVSVL